MTARELLQQVIEDPAMREWLTWEDYWTCYWTMTPDGSPQGPFSRHIGDQVICRHTPQFATDHIVGLLTRKLAERSVYVKHAAQGHFWAQKPGGEYPLDLTPDGTWAKNSPYAEFPSTLAALYAACKALDAEAKPKTRWFDMANGRPTGADTMLRILRPNQKALFVMRDGTEEQALVCELCDYEKWMMLNGDVVELTQSEYDKLKAERCKPAADTFPQYIVAASERDHAGPGFVPLPVSDGVAYVLRSTASMAVSVATDGRESPYDWDSMSNNRLADGTWVCVSAGNARARIRRPDETYPQYIVTKQYADMDCPGWAGPDTARDAIAYVRRDFLEADGLPVQVDGEERTGQRIRSLSERIATGWLVRVSESNAKRRVKRVRIVRQGDTQYIVKYETADEEELGQLWLTGSRQWERESWLPQRDSMDWVAVLDPSKAQPVTLESVAARVERLERQAH